jgi:Xaa-Pro aminopeptidase
MVPGALLLLDLWAKEPGGIYADQTWMIAIGSPSERAAALWNVVQGARDAALDLLRRRLEAGEAVAGAEADRAARAVIDAAGYADRIICRTGHSIDRVGLHGYGPTIDDTESYDTRDPARGGLLGRAGHLHPGRDRAAERGERARPARRAGRHAGGLPAGADRGRLRPALAPPG